MSNLFAYLAGAFGCRTDYECETMEDIAAVAVVVILAYALLGLFYVWQSQR